MGHHPTCHPSSCLLSLLPFAPVAAMRHATQRYHAPPPPPPPSLACSGADREARDASLQIEHGRWAGRIGRGWCAGNLYGWAVWSGLGTRCINTMLGPVLVDIWPDDSLSLRGLAGMPSSAIFDGIVGPIWARWVGFFVEEAAEGRREPRYVPRRSSLGRSRPIRSKCFRGSHEKQSQKNRSAFLYPPLTGPRRCRWPVAKNDLTCRGSRQTFCPVACLGPAPRRFLNAC